MCIFLLLIMIVSSCRGIIIHTTKSFKFFKTLLSCCVPSLVFVFIVIFIYGIECLSRNKRTNVTDYMEF